MRYMSLGAAGLLLAFLTGCFSAFGINSSAVTSIVISEFDSFGSIEGEEITTLEEKEEIEAFINAIGAATEQQGAVDMSAGDIDARINIEEDKEEGFHLWLDEESEQGSIMKVDETSTLYSIPKHAADELKELLP
ncbi:hypothetical protein [Alteribacillus sp. YIM 98480]|uniref:hypothetical protein n=1 Tax=Alteribacillus sp. YIM 98480 TaxID=2606599 RepID=UPI00131D1073|nr:hypothetical protein [Alteribacillus sp. YIM 98480]